VKKGGNLINAPSDKEFIFHDGARAKNFLELVGRLEHMGDHEFHHFVTPHKNDFANWTDHVLHDKPFSEKLRAVYSKDDTVKLIKEKINELTLGVTLGNSILKVPRLEDHHNSVEHYHDEYHEEKKHEEHNNKESEDKHHETKTHEHSPKHQLDEVPSIEEIDNAREKSHELKASHNWFRLFSKKNTTDKRLEEIERKEEDKLNAERMLKEESIQDGHENILWIILYFSLVLLIIILLVYKLFL
jgi:hypothetical protein